MFRLRSPSPENGLSHAGANRPFFYLRAGGSGLRAEYLLAKGDFLVVTDNKSVSPLSVADPALERGHRRQL